MRNFALSFSFLLALLLLVSSAPVLTRADSVDEIKEQIEEIERQRAELDEEIRGYQRQLDVLSGQKQTLQGAIQSLDVSRSKTATQIREIQKKIESATLKLSELSYEIGDKEASIALDQAAVAASLREVDRADDVSLIESLLSANDLAEAWERVDSLYMLSGALNTHAAALAAAKSALAEQHVAVSTTKKSLSSANVELSSQKKALDVNRAEKATLLSQTQSAEAQFQDLIAKKRAAQAAFDAELTNLQGQLASVNSTSIPSAGSGILSWPFSASQMQSCAERQSTFGNLYCLTQYFGNTAFARSGAYNGAGHNGVDFGVPTGTPLLASLSGTVMGTGNTDAAPGCYSFGKWVAIRHANGLATVYAHLSSIQVSKGQEVATGDLVGYSGMTGYATGPHLHFGVYAVGSADTPGIQIMTLSQFRNATSPCANVAMPVAPLNAYLNPMSYL